MTTTPDPVRQRAQEVAESEVAPWDGLEITRAAAITIARCAYFQGRVDVREEFVRDILARDAELQNAATAARSIA